LESMSVRLILKKEVKPKNIGGHEATEGRKREHGEKHGGD